MKIRIQVDGDIHDVELVDGPDWHAKMGPDTWPIGADRNGAGAVVRVDGQAFTVGGHDRDTIEVDGRRVPFRILALQGVAGADAGTGGGHGPIHAPMTGKLDAIRVKQGDTVAAGDVLFVLEAMKMRNEVKAQGDAIVGKIRAKAGAAVDPKTVILELLPAE